MAGVTIIIDPVGPEITNEEVRPTPVIITPNDTFGDKEIDTAENAPTGEKEENETNQERRSKRGISITRALVLFGYDSWVALEPGKQT